MLKPGPARKVTVYLNEDTQLHQRVMDFLFAKGVAGATLLHPTQGFGAHHRQHTPAMEATMEHLPIRIEFIEVPEKVDRLMPFLYDLVTDGLIELHDTSIVKAAITGKPDFAIHETVSRTGPAVHMRIFLGEADQWEGEPLYDAIVKRLRMLEVAGATVYRGVLGYGAKGHTHKKSFFHLSRDLPVMISVIDAADKIAQAEEAVAEMLQDGLIVTSAVQAIRVTQKTHAG